MNEFADRLSEEVAMIVLLLHVTNSFDFVHLLVLVVLEFFIIPRCLAHQK
jgi:hypothetical protein